MRIDNVINPEPVRWNNVVPIGNAGSDSTSSSSSSSSPRSVLTYKYAQCEPDNTIESTYPAYNSSPSKDQVIVDWNFTRCHLATTTRLLTYYFENVAIWHHTTRLKTYHFYDYDNYNKWNIIFQNRIYKNRMYLNKDPQEYHLEQNSPNKEILAVC